MPTKFWMLAFSACAALAGCGDTALTRGASGAAIGAGVGEVVADEPLIGAGVGAGAGVLTD